MQLAFSIKEVFPPARLYGESGGEVSGIAKLASDILLILTGAAAIIAFIFIIIGGFKFVTSGGDPKAVAGARTTLTYAIIGIILVVVSWLILLLIRQVTGVDTTTVTIPESP